MWISKQQLNYCIRLVFRKNVDTMRQCINYLQTSRKCRGKAFYSVLIEFGIPLKKESLINLCLNETYV